MTQITLSNGTWGYVIGHSEDGRIETASIRPDVKIDGRLAWRGAWCGEADPARGEKVPADLWNAARQVMGDVAAAQTARDEAARAAAEARLSARDDALEGIERVRGGTYDPNTF